MLQKFKNHLRDTFLFLKGKKLLLATSGGIDSMVMVHLFKELNYTIGLAHCNFQLRGLESFEDQNFIQDYAQAHCIEVFITQFDTTAFAKDYKISTQVAARELRYNWFYELARKENYDYILTAHHADDNLETFFINLSRGTGLEGLTGIPEQNDQIIRPLLVFGQDEIAQYAQANGVTWREDSSNKSDKYLRNKIRHHLVPILKEINPNFLSSFNKTQIYLQEANHLVEDATIMIYQQVATQQENSIRFDLQKLKKLPNYKSYLYQWLNEFGFTAWQDIYDLVESQSGKSVFSLNYQLLKNRETLLLFPLDSTTQKSEFYITADQKEITIPLKISFLGATQWSIESDKTIFVDTDQLQYPLVLRLWNSGDYFLPLGMQGKSKKISKFFKDQKLSVIEKENTWLLCSNEKVVWVVGHRQDERFKIQDTTKNILKIQLQ